MSPIEKVRAIPEIISFVFSFLQGDNRALLNAALTCKLWEPLALSVLWEELEDGSENYLLRLITSMDQVYDRPIAISAVDYQKWPRLHRYSQWVRSIEWSETNVSVEELLITIQSIAAANGTMFGLPHIHRMAYELKGTNIFCLLPFLQPSLRRFDISASSNTRYGSNILTLIASRCHTLERLTLWIDLPEADLSASASSFKELLNLKQAILPANTLISPHFWNALGSLPVLEDLHIWTNHLPLPSTTVTLQPGSFPQLTTLSVLLNVSDLLGLLGDHAPPMLASLIVHLFSDEGIRSSEVQALVEQLGEQFPKLNELKLIIQPVTDQLALQLGVPHLTPLLQCSLHTLSIQGEVAFDFDDTELSTLVSNLPSLHTLVLLHHAIDRSFQPTTRLTLNVLEMLAHVRPSLTRISLFLNTNQADPRARRKNPSVAYASFKYDVLLDFGKSAVRREDVMTIAMWLAGICPETVGTLFGGKRDGLWDDVDALFEPLQEHMMSLIAPKVLENEDLKEQNAGLKARLAELEAKLQSQEADVEPLSDTA